MLVWGLVMGVGAHWLSGVEMGWVGGVVGVVLVGVVGAFTVGCGGEMGWVGTAGDRMGTAVCLVWLILFEGAFFFGAVWCWGVGVVDG